MISFNNIPDKTEFKNTTSLKFKQDVIEFFKDKNLNTCLEIGTNHGWTTRILSDLFKNVYTVDHSIDNTNNAKNNNTGKNNISFITADAYNSNTYLGLPKMDVVFIDCIHTYDGVLYDINTAISLMDKEKGMFFIFDDYGHPTSTGVKEAILKAINEGLKVETYIGQLAGYSYNEASTLIDSEGIILSYGK
jgi:SAM-dependent methyltransferase